MNEVTLEKRLAQAEAEIETLKTQYALCLKSLEASTTLVDTLLAKVKAIDEWSAQSVPPTELQLEQRRQQIEAQLEQRRQQAEAQIQQQRQQAEAQIQQQRQQAEAQIQQQRQQMKAQFERQRQDLERLTQRASA